MKLTFGSPELVPPLGLSARGLADLARNPRYPEEHGLRLVRVVPIQAPEGFQYEEYRSSVNQNFVVLALREKGTGTNRVVLGMLVLTRRAPLPAHLSSLRTYSMLEVRHAWRYRKGYVLLNPEFPEVKYDQHLEVASKDFTFNAYLRWAVSRCDVLVSDEKHTPAGKALWVRLVTAAPSYHVHAFVTQDIKADYGAYRPVDLGKLEDLWEPQGSKKSPLRQVRILLSKTNITREVDSDPI